MKEFFSKPYEPQAVEKEIYDFWLEGGYFHAEPDSSKKPYTIMMPPPNITDQLHVGHAMTMTTQDVLIRWKRMQGFRRAFPKRAWAGKNTWSGPGSGTKNTADASPSS